MNSYIQQLILFLLLFHPVSSMAQQYFPLSIGDKWNYQAQFVDFEGFGFNWNDSVYVEKDTLILSQHYLVLHGPFFPFNNIVRLDQHYMYVYMDSTEIPFFDFSADTGATYSAVGYTITVGVDSFSYFHGEHKALSFAYRSAPYYRAASFSPKFGMVHLSWSGGQSSNDYFLVDCFIDGVTYNWTTSVKTEARSPGDYSLEQNYPNPCNPTTDISFRVPTTQFVKLTVFNLLGQEISELLNGFVSSGEHHIAFHGQNLSSGVYLYRLESANFTQTKKLILLR